MFKNGRLWHHHIYVPVVPADMLMPGSDDKTVAKLFTLDAAILCGQARLAEIIAMKEGARSTLTHDILEAQPSEQASQAAIVAAIACHRVRSNIAMVLLQWAQGWRRNAASENLVQYIIK